MGSMATQGILLRTGAIHSSNARARAPIPPYLGYQKHAFGPHPASAVRKAPRRTSNRVGNCTRSAIHSKLISEGSVAQTFRLKGSRKFRAIPGPNVATIHSSKLVTYGRCTYARNNPKR